MPQAHHSAAALDAFIREIYALRDEAALTQLLLRDLSSVVRCENVLVGRHHPDSRQALQLNLRHPFSKAFFLESVNATGAAADHPIWEIEPGEPKCLSHMMSRAQWHRHALYCDFLKEDAVEDHLTLDLPGAGGTFTMIGLLRDRRGFSTEELDRMRLLSTHLRQAFDNARFYEKALARDGNGLLQTSVFQERRHFATNAELNELFRRYSAEWAAAVGRDRAVEPGVFHAWAAEQIDWLNRGRLDSATAALRLEGPAGSLELRLARNWGGVGFFLIEAHEQMTERRLVLLTPRERDVFDTLRTGRSDAEIAAILEMSRHTVKGHLKTIYRKLGIAGRLQAAKLQVPSSNV